MSEDDKVQNSITGEIRPSSRSVTETDPLALRGDVRRAYPFPVPPQNLRVFHLYEYGSFDVRWDDPRMNPNNSGHNIIGVNLYRSIDSTEGPYTKVNSTPIGVNFYRDSSENIRVEEELVNNATHLRIEDKSITVCAENFPFVTDDEINDYEFDPDKITVLIDGVQVRAKTIKPRTGEIELYSEPEYDPVYERYFDLVIPTDTSEIKISYTYNSVYLQRNVDFDQRIYYKVTSVTASGKETPLEQAYLASYQDMEGLTYIWANIVTKQNFLLDQGGERAWVFIQRSAGEPCPEHDHQDVETYGDEKWRNCKTCFGTGFDGGFIGPFEVQLAPFDAEISYKHSNKGRVVSKNNESFLTNYPVVRQGDLIVRQNGERYMIGPVKRKEPNGILVQQNFTLHIVQPRDVLYRVGMNERKPKFNTRYHDWVHDDKRYLSEKGKTPRFRNIHRIPGRGTEEDAE